MRPLVSLLVALSVKHCFVVKAFRGSIRRRSFKFLFIVGAAVGAFR